MRRFIPVFTLLALFSWLVFSSVITKSPVCDEAGHHIAAGYSYVKLGDFRMNPASPPLVRNLMGFPLLFLNLKLPTDHAAWQENNSSEFSRQFLYVYNTNAEQIVFLSRLPMIVLSLLLGWLVFFWAGKLFGYKAGIFALFLYALSPDILGNAGLAMADMGGSLFVFLAVFQYWRLLRCRERLGINLILAGICFGLAQSAKCSSILLYPLFFIFALIEALKDGQGRQAFIKQAKFLFIIFALGLLTLWATYAFEFKPLLKNAPDVEEKINYIRMFLAKVPFLGQPAVVKACIRFAQEIPIPLSTYIVTLLGIANQVVAGQQGVYFMGKYYASGVLPYYLIDYAIKTPLALFALIALSINFSLLKRRSKTQLQNTLFLLFPIAIIFISASFSRLQGGVRYLLPAYPFLFVWLSDTINVGHGQKPASFAGKIALGLLIFWYGAASFRAYPHYLAYFNGLVDGPGGFGCKVTHDCDWGQDIKELKRYLDEKGIPKIKYYCFATADPSYYGIKFEPFSEEDFNRPVIGAYYAISTRYLPAVKWSNAYRPIDKVGYTIFIYRISK